MQCPMWTGNWNLLLFEQNVRKFLCYYVPPTGKFDSIWLYSVLSIQSAPTLRCHWMKHGLKITTYSPLFFVLYWEWQKERLPSPTLMLCYSVCRVLFDFLAWEIKLTALQSLVFFCTTSTWDDAGRPLFALKHNSKTKGDRDTFGEWIVKLPVRLGCWVEWQVGRTIWL
jgi:hypothetical protein